MPKGEYLAYGGQAIIEGVMMRSPKHWSVACRAPNGKIVLHSQPMEKTWIGRQKWLKLPFLRGSLGILDALVLGTKALRFSADVQLAEPFQKGRDSDPDELGDGVVRSPEGSLVVTHRHEKGKGVHAAGIGMALFGGLALGLILFSGVPNYVAELSERLGITDWRIRNLIAELIKIIFFLLYVWLIGFNKEIKSVFEYHGAEHKAINTMEADQDLTPENAFKQTRLHPRCGTSFAIIVLILSLLTFTFVPRYPLGESTFYLYNVVVRIGIELLLLPIVAGVAYEAIRLAGKFRNQMWVKFAFAPGLGTQFLTTREPRPDQIEVALVALREVVERDNEVADLEEKKASA